MMEPRDYMSMLVGLVVVGLGAIPFLEKAGTIDWGLSSTIEKFLGANIAIYLVAGLGLYLAIESLIEITNSNAFGGFSLLVAAVVTIVGLVPLLSNFGVLPFALPFALSQTIFQILFIVIGLFLIIAGFAMEM